MMPRRAPWALLALLAAGCITWYDDDDYPVSVEDYARYIDTLAVSTLSAPSDGFSTVRVTAQLRAPGKDQVVVFSASTGSFGEGLKTIEVPVGPDGASTALLTTPVQPGTARIEARVKGVPQVVRAVEVSFTPPVLDSILRFAAVPDTIVADGATPNRIEVRTSPGLFDGKRKVVLQASRGTFAESGASKVELTIAQNGVTAAHLVSPDQVGFVTLTAGTASFSREVTIHARPAYPQQIVVDAGRFLMQSGADKEYAVTARLRRVPGRVSPGLAVAFSAVDSTGRTFGAFRAVTTTSAEGEATATFSPGATEYQGWVLLRARVPGWPVVGEARVTVVKP